MKTINCVNCDKNILEMELNDHRASVYFSDYNPNTNRFERMRVMFNEAYPWKCEHCDEDIEDEKVFDALQEYLPTLEDLEDVDFNILSSNGVCYVEKVCECCKEKHGNDYSDITEEGIEIIAEVNIKFDKNLNRFKISSIENPLFNPVTCDSCGSKLSTSFDKDKFQLSVEIPFF